MEQARTGIVWLLGLVKIPLSLLYNTLSYLYGIVTAPQGDAQRVKRLYLLIGVALALLVYYYSFAGGQSPPDNLRPNIEIPNPTTAKSKCINAKLNLWKRQFRDPLIYLARGDKNNDFNNQFAYIGNGYLAADVMQHELFVGPHVDETPQSRLPFPLPSVKISSTLYEPTLEVVGVDRRSGLVRKLYHADKIGSTSPESEESSSSNPCLLLEELWYAHRKYPSVLVYELSVHNPFAESSQWNISIEKAHIQQSHSFHRLELSKNFTASLHDDDIFDVQLARLTPYRAGLYVSSFVDTRVRAKKAATTTLRSLISAQIISSSQELEPLTGNNAMAYVSSSAPLSAALKTMLAEMHSLNLARDKLLIEHELAWNDLWDIDFSASMEWGLPASSSSHPLLMFEYTSLTAYYLASALDMGGPRYATQRKPLALERAEESAAGTRGCFDTGHIREVSRADLLQFPTTLNDVDAFVDRWLEVFEKAGCRVPNLAGTNRAALALHSYLQGLAGLRVTSNIIRVLPTDDIPRSQVLKLSGLTFLDHKLSFTLTNSRVEVARLDSLSTPLYVLGMDDEEAALLGAQQILSETQGVLYISNDPFQLDQLSEVLPNDPKNPKTKKKLKKKGVGRMLLYALFGIIFVFHIVLIVFIYREFCT